MVGEPIDGEILLLTSAKASVAPSRLPELINLVQDHLETDIRRFRKTTECIFEEPDRVAFLIEGGFWDRLGTDLELDDREIDAVRRAHTEQLRRIGRKIERHDEFETALEIRDPIFISLSSGTAD